MAQQDENGNHAHTPGPWRYEYDNMGNGGFHEWYNIETKDEHIGRHDRHIGRVDKEADARLIAAAPALLMALENLTVIKRLDDGGVVIGPVGWEQTRAAIAAAKGD